MNGLKEVILEINCLKENEDFLKVEWSDSTRYEIFTKIELCEFVINAIG